MSNGTVHFSVKGWYSLCFVKIRNGGRTMRVEKVTCKACKARIAEGGLDASSYGNSAMDELHAWALQVEAERRQEGREAFELALLVDAAHDLALREAAERSREAEPCQPFKQSHGCGCCRHYGPCYSSMANPVNCLDQACTQCGGDCYDDDEEEC